MLLFLFLLLFIRGSLLVSEAFSVTHLPGFLQEGSLPFHLETGYIEVDEFHGVELFYYFIESERNPTEDPLLLWLNGGPGCSAFTGLAIEIGPLKFRSERYNGSLPKLVYNPYSWTKISNVIFLDSPVGTGFSFSNHPQGYETGDKSWSKHAVIFLRKLQGYMVGNPVTGEVIDQKSLVPFAYGMGIISDELYQRIGKNCKGEDYDSPKNVVCASLLQIFDEFKSELMIQQILEPKCSVAATKPKYTAGSRRRSILQQSNMILLGPPILEVKCRSYAYYLMYIWANNNDVQEALHVKKGKAKELQ